MKGIFGVLGVALLLGASCTDEGGGDPTQIGGDATEAGAPGSTNANGGLPSTEAGTSAVAGNGATSSGGDATSNGGGNAGAAVETGASGNAGESQGGAPSPGASCGCPDGFTLNPQRAGLFPTCDPPAGECQAPRATCSRAHAAASCANKQCELGACEPRWDDCDGKPDNGCEADLASPQTCGACNNVCSPGQLCKDGACVDVCDAPRKACSGRCVNLGSSTSDCGACDSDCHGGSCITGKCQQPCQAEYATCGSSCTFGDCPAPKCVLCPPLYGPDRPCSVATPQTDCCGGDYQYTNTIVGPICKYTGPSIDCQANCDESPLAWITGLGAPEGLVVAGGKVFWADPVLQEVAGASEADGVPWQVAGDLATPKRVAHAAGKVYWTDELGSVVMRADEGGALPAEPIASANGPLGLAVDDSYVYWADVGSVTVQRAPREGGKSVVVWQGSKQPNPYGPRWVDSVAVDASSLYLLEHFSLSSVATGMNYRRYAKSDFSATTALQLLNAPQSALSVVDGGVSIAAADRVTVDDDLAVDLFGFSDGKTLETLSRGYDFTSQIPSVARGQVFTYWSNGHMLMRSPNCVGAAKVLANINGQIRALALGEQYLYFTVDDWIGRLPLEP